MADSVVLEQLKTNRTNSRRLFLRLSNTVRRMASVMSEEELKDSLKTLITEANKVFEANEDVEDQFSQESGGALTDQQRADVHKVSSECEEKLAELKELIVTTLWVKFGEEELSLALEAAETEVQRVQAIEVSEDKDTFDFMMEQLEELVRRARVLHNQWKSWAPPEEQQQLQSKVRELERALMKLTARKAEFIKVRGKNKPSFVSSAHKTAASTKTKPGPLPKFPGLKGDFWIWRKEWEHLQEQVDPTGSKEVKKVQLLCSIDDKIKQDLQLKTCTTAEDILKALENHFGNNSVNNADDHQGEVQEDPEQSSSAPECIICGHSKHGLRLYFCRKFQALKLKEKKEAVKKLGACKMCLEVHSDTSDCKTEFLCQGPECSDEQHHYCLCPRKERPRTFTALKSRVSVGQGGAVKPRSYLTLGGGVKPLVYTRVTAVGGNPPRKYTRAQQEFVKKLPPDLAKEFRQAFRSSASSTVHNHTVPRTVPPTDPQNHSAPRAAQPHHNQSDRGFRGRSVHNHLYHQL